MRKQLLVVLALLVVMLCGTSGWADSFVDIKDTNTGNSVGFLSYDYMGGGQVQAAIYFFSDGGSSYFPASCDSDCVLEIGLLSAAVDTPTINYSDGTSASSSWTGLTTIFALNGPSITDDFPAASVTFASADQVRYIAFSGNMMDPADFTAILGSIDANAPLVPTNPPSVPEPSSLALLGSGLTFAAHRLLRRRCK